MTLPLPLAVRMQTARADRHITRDLTGLRFRDIAYGGYASCSFALSRPITIQPDEIAYYGRVYVYDTRNGKTVWEGRLEDPGRSAGADGPMWSLAAVGGSAHLTDTTQPLIYVDRRLDPWTVGGAALSANYLRVDTRTDEDGTAVVQIQAPSGVTFLAGAAGLVVYSALVQAGMLLGRVNVGWRSGFTNTSCDARLGSSIGTGATTAVETDVLSVTSGTLTGSRGGANAIPASHDTARLRLQRNTTNLAGGDTIWLEFTNPIVRALLKSAAGVDITSGYSLDTILATDVVNDLLGRVLTRFDGAGAMVATTSYAIEQLAYPDGVAAAQVLTDMVSLEPTMRYGAYESNPVTGLTRFEFWPWPTSVRYEADITDGYDSTGSADGLYNACLVRYKSPTGQIQSVVRTSSVPELTAASLTRQFEIDLGDEISSLANAQRVGDQFLVDHAAPPNQGRLTIARPVLDLYTGRMVMPWEIMSGNLIRVRGVRPSVDALNTTSRDGVTVFKIQAKDFDAGSCAAQLDLDSWAPSTTRALASAATTRTRRR